MYTKSLILFVALLCLSGCTKMEKFLNPEPAPKKVEVVEVKEKNPDTAWAGGELNEVEQAYIDEFNKSSERSRAESKKRVFSF